MSVRVVGSRLDAIVAYERANAAALERFETTLRDLRESADQTRFARLGYYEVMRDLRVDPAKARAHVSSLGMKIVEEPNTNWVKVSYA